MARPRRTCSDRTRYHRLCELRKWYRDTLSSFGYVKRDLIISRPEVIEVDVSPGWVTWVRVTFLNGRAWSVDGVHTDETVDKVATRLYRLLRHDLVKEKS